MPSLRSAVSQPTLIGADLNGAGGSGAVRPRRGTAFAVEAQRHAVLRRLGRGGRVAVTAGGLPRGLVELVLAAVLAAARDRARVATGLALGDLLQLGRELHVRSTAARLAAAAAGGRRAAG